MTCRVGDVFMLDFRLLGSDGLWRMCFYSDFAVGSFMVNVVPFFGVLFTWMWPLCRSIMCFTIDRPRPDPSAGLFLAFSAR